MKGLAKKNNKTRGKTNRRKKNNRKTIRKRNKRGGAGFEIEIPLSQQKAELINEKDELINELKSHEEAYKSKVEQNNEIFKKLNTDLNTILDNYKNMSPKNNNGYTEAKNDDENTQPNIKKRTGIKAEFKQKKEERDSKKDKLQREIFEEHTKLNKKRKEIQDKLTEIEKDIKEIEKDIKFAIERQMNEDEKDAKINEEIEKNKQDGIYTDPYNVSFDHVSQVEKLKRSKLDDIEADNEEYNKREEAGLFFNGGKKRKTYKKRK